MPCRGPDDDIYPSVPPKSVVAGYEAKLADMKRQRDEATAAACNLAALVRPGEKLLPATAKWLKEHEKHDEDRARKAFEAYMKKHGADAAATLLGDK